MWWAVGWDKLELAGASFENQVGCRFKPTPPKASLGKQEMLQRIEKAYKEGKMTEAQYLKNKEKFQ